MRKPSLILIFDAGVADTGRVPADRNTVGVIVAHGASPAWATTVAGCHDWSSKSGFSQPAGASALAFQSASVTRTFAAAFGGFTSRRVMKPARSPSSLRTRAAITFRPARSLPARLADRA